MSYPAAIWSSARGWPPAVRFRGAALLNERWHRPRRDPDQPRCPVCEGKLTVADHAVHYGGEILHPACLLYESTLA